MLLLILLLRFAQLETVVMEDHSKLQIKVSLQLLTLEDGLEPVEQIKGALDRCNRLEGLVDELSQAILEVGNANIEIDIVSVEGVAVEIKEVVPLARELLQHLVE